MMLRTEQLNVILENKQILQKIDFQVKPGEIITILGPNGAGKSTLLKSLSGDVTGVMNQVKLDDCALLDYSPEELAQRRAVMPQSVQLDFPFLVSEVIEMSILKPMKQAEKLNYVKQALALFDVDHLMARNYLTLSGGEQQRVQLARVVGQLVLAKSHDDEQQKYLFLDECTSSLDLSHQHQVFKVVADLVKNYSIGVVSVLHDLNLAAQYSDKLVLMKNGELFAQGSVNEVLTEKNVSEVYQYPVQIISHPNGWPLVISKEA